MTNAVKFPHNTTVSVMSYELLDWNIDCRLYLLLLFMREREVQYDISLSTEQRVEFCYLS